MYDNEIVENITNVFDGNLKPGILPYKYAGREYDAFVYYISGKTKYYFDNYEFLAQKGNVLYLAKGAKYSMEVLENVSFICIDFNFLKSDHSRNSEIFTSFPDGTKNLFLKVMYLWLNKSPIHNVEIIKYIYELYIQCLKVQSKPYSKSNILYLKAMNFISENYCNSELSILQLSEHLNISPMHLRRIFNNEMNMSPTKFITYLRIEKAKALLINSNCSIAEISNNVGIKDPYYFSKMFKKEIGISPYNYRMQEQNQCTPIK